MNLQRIHAVLVHEISQIQINQQDVLLRLCSLENKIHPSSSKEENENCYLTMNSIPPTFHKNRLIITTIKKMLDSYEKWDQL